MKKGPWVIYDGELWTRAELDAHRAHEAQKKRSTAVPAVVRKVERGRWVLRDGNWVDVLSAPPLPKPPGGPQVVRDWEPYKGVGLPGQPVVQSRAHHRELLRRHGKIEVGNEFKNTHDTGPKPKLGPAAADVADAFRRLGVIG